MEESKKLDYRNKIILAPMVRVGTLPMRLLALEYGADIVYTEELIDWKLLKTKRRENLALGTIDFVDQTDGTVVFRTCALEKGKVVVQLGTADHIRALKAAKLVENDVAGIDINMGCPKEFSIKGGMGIKLLNSPDKATAILRALTENLSIPVTCKIRIFPNVDESINLIKEFEKCGISAIAIHGRYRNERSHHPVHIDTIKKIAESISIPVIANGGSEEIKKYSDINKFRKNCGASSCMIARAAQWNCSIFRKEGILPIDEVITTYLKYSVDYDNSPGNSKYCIQRVLKELQESERGRKFLDSQTMEHLCDIWGLKEYCRAKQLEFQEKGIQGRRELKPSDLIIEGPRIKRLKTDGVLSQHNVVFVKGIYNTLTLPKSLLHSYALRNDKDLPTYEIEREDKLFRAVICFDEIKYASTYWEKNKKIAEQGAALVCLLELGIVSKQTLIENGSLLR